MTRKIKRYLLFIFVVFSTPSFSQGWKQLITNGNITPRSNASAIYVSPQHKLFVFGGVTGIGNTNELWCLDLSSKTWTTIPSPSIDLPAPRFTHVCMFDSLQNRMLLWSGQGDVLYNDVWAFNFKDSTWQKLFEDGNVSGAPLKRYGTATVFDPKNRNLINFAGFTTAGRFDDTWSFKVDSKTWTDHTNSFFPLKRCLTSASFAPERREMIVFGGQSSGNLKDIWKLNTDSYTWVDLSPAVAPVARHFSSNVYCGKGHVVVFGGDTLNQGNKAGAVNDLWTFSLDTKQWKSLPQADTLPFPRYGHTAVYIPEEDKLVIFGGQGTTSLFDDTWVYEHISDVINSVKKEETETIPFSCFPNSFAEQTQLHFSLKEKSAVTISITDISGRIVARVLDATLARGDHVVKLNNKLPAGIYLCSLTTEKKQASIRIQIIH